MQPTERERFVFSTLYAGRLGRQISVMPDESDPPRKYYDFKLREFDRANKTDRPPPPAPSVNDPMESAYDPNLPIDIHKLHKLAQAPGPRLQSGAPRPAENEVHEILRENLARADAAGLNDVPIKPQKLSKRARDYWLLFVLGNLTMVTVAVNAYRTGNAILFVYMMAGIGLFNAGITWIMWFVMDKY